MLSFGAARNRLSGLGEDRCTKLVICPRWQSIDFTIFHRNNGVAVDKPVGRGLHPDDHFVLAFQRGIDGREVFQRITTRFIQVDEGIAIRRPRNLAGRVNIDLTPPEHVTRHLID